MTSALPAAALGMVFLAGLLRGFTGFGFSLAAVPLLSVIMPPAEAVPIVLLLQVAVSAIGLREALGLCDWASLRLLALGAALATPFGAWGLALLPAAATRLAIAAVVAAGGLVLARGFRLAVVPTGAGVLPFGLLCGLFNGLAAIPGPPVIAFYLAAPLPSRVARASMIVLFLATALLGLAPLAWLGLVGRESLVAALAGLPAVLLGSWMGGRLYHGGTGRHYRRVAVALVLATAVLAAWRAVVDLLPGL